MIPFFILELRRHPFFLELNELFCEYMAMVLQATIFVDLEAQMQAMPPLAL